MDKELKQELEWINENLKLVVRNQTVLYCKMRKIEKKISCCKSIDNEER